MAQRPGVKIRSRPVRTYDAAQLSWSGAQDVAGRRGWWPQLGVVSGPGSPYVSEVFRFGGRIIIAGDFNDVGGETRIAFAAIEADTGLVPTVGWSGTLNGGFAQAFATDGTYLYVGGAFDEVDDGYGGGPVNTINGSPIAGLVRFDYDGVLDQTWNPVPNASPNISVLTYNQDRGTLYVGGSGLTSIGGQGRIRAAEIYVATGLATTWNPAPDDVVFAIVPDLDRELVYLGGDFLNLGASPKVRLGRTDYAGTVEAWAPAPNDTVYDVLPDSKGAYAVGFFTSAGVTPAGRGGGAFLDDQGELRAWDPLADVSVKRIRRYREFLFLAGDFTSCDGVARNGLALVHDADHWRGGNQDHDDWDPGLDVADVQDVFLVDRTLYVAGTFTSSSVSANGLVQAISWPIFTDANSIFFSKAGDDADAGTEAAPKLTPEGADAARDDDHRYMVCLDSGTYDLSEPLSMAFAQTWQLPGGLFSADGFDPVLQIRRGTVPGTFGARKTGRTKFSTGLAATFLYVEKNGDDGSGTRGDPSKPFKTHAAAIVAALTGDTIQTQDSGLYIEDLVIGNKSLIFQAADGQLPVLQNGAGAIHFDVEGTGTLAMYGYTIADIPKTTGSCFYVKRNLTLWDCTVSGNNVCVQVPVSANTLTVSLNGSIFHKVNAQVVLLQKKDTTVLGDNVLFEGCSAFCPAQPFAVIGYFFTSLFVDQNPNITLSRVEFRDTQSLYTVYMRNHTGAISFTLQGTTEVNRSLFTASTPRLNHGVVYDCFVANPVILSDVTFQNLGGSAVYGIYPGDLTITANRVLADHCGRAGVYPAFWIASTRIASNADVYFADCVAIKPTGNGFLFQYPATVVSYQGRLDLIRCDVQGPGADGIAIYSAPANPASSAQWSYVDSCLIQGIPPSSVGFRATGGSPSRIFISYSVIQGNVVGGPTLSTGFAAGDPLFLDVTDGTENLGLSPNSQAFDAYQNQVNMGLRAPLLSITAAAARFWIDGFILAGDRNTYDGVGLAFGLVAPVEVSWDTFDGLGPQGAQLASGSDSRNCLYSTNGPAINAADSGGEVSRNVGARCTGAFLVVGGTNLKSQNNTAYRCQYGQFDLFGAQAAFSKNQIFSASSVLDYAGPNTIEDSDVERKSDDATITGTRRAPLFRDLASLDLRLQAINAGNFFDSPAVGLADDGGDAGAFAFFYGPGTVAWELTELMQGGFVNPYWVPRHVWLAKVSEDLTWGGVTYSDASASGLEFVFEWPENAYMPQAQVDALQAIYEATDSGGECQLSFDGGTTWIPVVRLLSSGFDWQELRPLTFAWEGAPMRLARMIFRVQG